MLRGLLLKIFIGKFNLFKESLGSLVLPDSLSVSAGLDELKFYACTVGLLEILLSATRDLC